MKRKLVPLSPLAIARLYIQHLRKDFPPAERRPLLSMLHLRRKGLYQVYAMMDGGGTAGYASLAAGQSGALLLDYLAVCSGRRGKGEGSALLFLLKKKLSKAALFAEVEDPDSAGDDAERQTRLRRIRFYLKNGFCETDIRCRVFGVQYRILALNPKGDLRNSLDQIYRTLFPAVIYQREIHFLP